MILLHHPGKALTLGMFGHEENQLMLQLCTTMYMFKP